MKGTTTRQRLPVTLTRNETEALLSHLNTRTTTGLRNRALLEVLLGAGLRIAEACALLGRDYDPARAELRVNQGKGGKDRIVPVRARTQAWLTAWLERRAAIGYAAPTLPLFVGLRTGGTGSRHVRNAGEGIKPRYIQALVRRLAEAAQIPKHVTPHVLRHTYATNLLDEDFNIREVQTLLGHSDVRTTQVYTHVNPEEIRRKVQALDATPAPDPDTIDAATVFASLTVEQRQALLRLIS